MVLEHDSTHVTVVFFVVRAQEISSFRLQAAVRQGIIINRKWERPHQSWRPVLVPSIGVVFLREREERKSEGREKQGKAFDLSESSARITELHIAHGMTNRAVRFCEKM
jgi:hypothetical protein